MVLGCVCYDLMLVYYVYCVGALVAGYQTTEFSVYQSVKHLYFHVYLHKLILSN